MNEEKKQSNRTQSSHDIFNRKNLFVSKVIVRAQLIKKKTKKVSRMDYMYNNTSMNYCQNECVTSLNMPRVAGITSAND